ncbi:MAG: tRNA-intron lyase [Candidatus Nanoarchaeia archaeon]|nr:tRNA-intron lyase [Candidatus Nanoarchaeia archaeon]
MTFPIYILAGKLFSNSQKAFTLENTKKLGERKDNKIVYSEFEALYLAETYKAQIIKNSKTLSNNEIIKFFSKDKYFWEKYCVFKELRKKGYIVKVGIKFGGDFRVYSRPKNLRDFSANHHHAKYICYPTNSEKIDIKELISKTRVSHSTGKKFLLAFVDKEDDVLFYEIDWIKL